MTQESHSLRCLSLKQYLFSAGLRPAPFRNHPLAAWKCLSKDCVTWALGALLWGPCSTQQGAPSPPFPLPVLLCSENQKFFLIRKEWNAQRTRPQAGGSISKAAHGGNAVKRCRSKVLSPAPTPTPSCPSSPLQRPPSGSPTSCASFRDRGADVFPCGSLGTGEKGRLTGGPR